MKTRKAVPPTGKSDELLGVELRHGYVRLFERKARFSDVEGY